MRGQESEPHSSGQAGQGMSPACSCPHAVWISQNFSALQFLVDDDEEDAGAAAAVPALPEPDAKRAGKRRKVRLFGLQPYTTQHEGSTGRHKGT